MNKLIYVFFLSALFFSCSSSQDTFKKTRENNNNTEKDIVTKKEEKYSCNIELIDNRMPSSSVNDSYYAIVSLRAGKENFNQNWRLLSFEINNTTFDEFDDYALKGKNKAIYRNNVRAIAKNLEAPFDVKIQFENENGEKIEYELNDVQLTVVH